MNGAERSAARRRPSLALLCLTLFVLVLPLTLSRSWLPAMQSDEAAYYLAALSLWHDGDFAFEDADARRFFREYPETDNLKLTIGTEEPRAHFGVPLAYPILAMPAVALFGAKGMIAVNSALLMAMVWMGVSYLRRCNSESVSILFAVGFFVLSTAFVYVFWVQAEVFTMACVMAAFFLAERAAGTRRSSEWRPRSSRPPALSIAASGALLAVASYGKPMLAVLALPLVFLLVSERRWRAGATFVAAAVVSLLGLAGTTYLATNQLWPYFAPRAGVRLANPVNHGQRTVDYREPRQTSLVPTDRLKDEGNALRFTVFATLRTAIPEFFLGRHGGFLFYLPFAVLSIVFFLLNERRSVFGWLILASAALTAMLFVILIRGHWLGGGGFAGNRYFLAVYPSLFFLVRRVRPRALIALGYAAAAVFLGPLLITPLGAPAGFGPQSHVSNQPFPHLPFEWSLINTLRGDYASIVRSGVAFHGRRDEILASAGEIWVVGAQRVEINLLSHDPRRDFAFDVRNLAPDNRVEVCLQHECQELVFEAVPAAGETQRVTFEATEGEWIPRAGREQETYRYRMTIDSEWGEQPRWRGSGKERFYLGAALTFLGSSDVSGGRAAGDRPDHRRAGSEDSIDLPIDSPGAPGSPQNALDEN